MYYIHYCIVKYFLKFLYFLKENAKVAPARHGAKILLHLPKCRFGTAARRLAQNAPPEHFPGVAFFDGRLFLRVKTFVREPAAATLHFSSKTTEFRGKFYFFLIKKYKSNP